MSDEKWIGREDVGGVHTEDDDEPNTLDVSFYGKGGIYIKHLPPSHDTVIFEPGDPQRGTFGQVKPLRGGYEVRGPRGSGQQSRKLRSTACLLYIGSDDAVDTVRVLIAAQKLLLVDLDYSGFNIVSVEPGSVFMRISAWFRSIADKRQVRVVASQLVQTAEAMTVDKALAENAATQASAVAELLAASAHVDSLALDFGSLQYVQYKDEEGKLHAAARSFGSKEMAGKRLSEKLLRDPQQMFKALEAHGDTISTSSAS